MVLAGGNNITLSQNAGTITISGAAAAAGGSNTFGMSNLGNTSGTSGMVSGSAVQFAFAGGNNITLSQSINASSGTITVSAANQTVQTQNVHNVTLSGNTSGALAQISSGTLTLAGGNNVTLSQNGNAVTISAANQSTQTQNVHNITLSGNTSGVMAQISSGTLTLAGGNNITLSQNGNAVTVSAANQTVQTQNIHNVTLAGNTTGTLAQISSGTLTLAGGNNITLSQNGNAVTLSAASQTVQTQNIHNVTLAGNTTGTLAQISSGTLTLAGGNNITLSQNGNAVTIVGGAGGGGGGIALANSQATFTSGTVNLIEGGGAITIASTAGQSFQVSVPQTSSLSATGQLSISTNASTISMGVPILSQWMHNSAAALSSTTFAAANTSVSLARMILPNAISFSRVDVPVSVSGGTQSSANTAAVAFTAYGVLYSRAGSTLNPIAGQSSSTSYSYASNTGVYSSITGPRMMSFNLATSLAPGEYYMGLQISSNTSSVGTATTAPGFTFAPIAGTSNSVAPWTDLNAASNASINLFQPLQGVNSVSLSATNQTHQQSQITQSGTHGVRGNFIVILRNQ